MARDYGEELTPYLHVDATAAIGIAQRKGLGKLRHLDTQALWIQDAVRQRRVCLEKVLGTENPSDLMTKHLDTKSMDTMLAEMGVTTQQGRAKATPATAATAASAAPWTDPSLGVLQSWELSQRGASYPRARSTEIAGHGPSSSGEAVSAALRL